MPGQEVGAAMLAFLPEAVAVGRKLVLRRAEGIGGRIVVVDGGLIPPARGIADQPGLQPGNRFAIPAERIVARGQLPDIPADSRLGCSPVSHGSLLLRCRDVLSPQAWPVA
jgi:hypothetical protein